MGGRVKLFLGVGGGEGVETFWGADGIISVVQSFFMGIAIFPVGLFSVAGSVFLSKIYH